MQPNFQRPEYSTIYSQSVRTSYDDPFTALHPARSNPDLIADDSLPRSVPRPPTHQSLPPHTVLSYAVQQHEPIPTFNPFGCRNTRSAPPKRDKKLMGPGRYDYLSAYSSCVFLSDEHGGLDIGQVGCSDCGERVKLYGTEENPFKALSKWEKHEKACSTLQASYPTSTKFGFTPHPHPLLGWQAHLHTMDIKPAVKSEQSRPLSGAPQSSRQHARARPHDRTSGHRVGSQPPARGPAIMRDDRRRGVDLPGTFVGVNPPVHLAHTYQSLPVTSPRQSPQAHSQHKGYPTSPVSIREWELASSLVPGPSSFGGSGAPEEAGMTLSSVEASPFRTAGVQIPAVGTTPSVADWDELYAWMISHGSFQVY